MAHPTVDRHLVPGLLALRLVGLPAHRERLVEHRQQVGTPSGDLVVDGHRTREAGLTAPFRSTEEEQRRDVGWVGVEPQLDVGRVATASPSLDAGAEVTDVTQHVAAPALGDRSTDVLAESPPDRPQLGQRMVVDREAFADHHPLAVDELVPDRRDQAGHGRQREVACSHPVEGEVRDQRRGRDRGRLRSR